MQIRDQVRYNNQIWTIFHVFPNISDAQPILIGKDKTYLTVDKSELNIQNVTSLKQ